MDWRSLTKGQLVHLIESIHSDQEILDCMVKTREAQAKLNPKREVCHECRVIATLLGVER